MTVQRFSKPMKENGKASCDKDLDKTRTGAYKPAYKENPKTSQNQAQILPEDLAEIAELWPELPEHIKAAIKAMIETFRANSK